MRAASYTLLALLTLSLQPRAQAQAQQTVYITGKLDGYANPVNQDDFNRFYPTEANAFLLGMGDNLAFDYGSTHFGSAAVSRTGPNIPPAVTFLQGKKYAAMVPGVRDFYFGAAMLYRIGNMTRPSGAYLPMLGANIVVCRSQQAPAAGAPTQTQIMIPTEAALPSSVATPGGATGGGGGGKGKSGGSAAGNSGTSATSSSGAAQSTPSQTPSVGCGATPDANSSGSPIQLVYPAANQIYPWTSRLVLSVPPGVTINTGETSLGPAPAAAVKVPATASPGGTTLTVDLRTAMAICSSGEIIQDDSKEASAGCISDPAPPSNSQARLFPGNSIVLNLAYRLDGNTYHESLTLNVQIPFFQFAWKCEDENCGDNATPGRKVAFAVASPSLEAQIPLSNRELCEQAKPCTKNKNLSKVDFNEATSALIQATLAYEIQNHRQNLPVDKDTYYVMAQMSPDEAVAFARSLTFRYATFGAMNLQKHLWDVVFSAADAYAYTRAETQTLDSADPSDGPQQGVIPVITPRPLLLPGSLKIPDFSQPQDPSSLTLKDPVGVVTLSQAPDADRYGVTTLNYLPGNAQGPTCDSVAKYVHSVFHANTRSELETTILSKMAGYLKTDIAMIQHHELYLGCALNLPPDRDLSDRELVDRLLPEAGYLTRVSVTGATLQALLRANESILAQSPSPTQPMATEWSRSLALFGVSRGVVFRRKQDTPRQLPLGLIEPEDTYYVNGAPLDLTKTYSIATTEHLASAEPIFPQLQQQDLESPTTFFSPGSEARLVSDIAIGRSSSPATIDQVVGRMDPTPAPLVSRKGFWEQLAKNAKDSLLGVWLDSKTAAHPPLQSSLFLGTSQRQLAWQRRSYWDITLQQISAAWAYSHPNLSDTGIGNDFGGVSNPNVTTAHTDSVSAASNARALYSINRLFATGADEIIAYSRSHTGTTTPPTPSELFNGSPVPLGTTILSANTAIVSPFFAYSTFRSQPHWIPIVLRGLYNHDLSSTEQFLKSGFSFGIPCVQPCNPTSEPAYFELRPKPQWGWAPAIGTRFETSNLSYVEAGYLRQYSMNILTGVGVESPKLFTVLPIQPITSDRSAATILSAKPCSKKVPFPCLNDPGLGDYVVYRYNEVHQNGAYVLAFWNTNLFNLRQITSQSVVYGDIYISAPLKDRFSTETKYAVNATQSLNFNLFANFSLGPQYALFLYKDEATENRTVSIAEHITTVTYHPNSLTRQQLSIQLNWNFDWHTGLPPRSFLGKQN